ncbi:hypothetical protein NSK_000335 [Nannochloropsis salina CCMP1776]|uniref:Uncharacterized protein n=1 Tax=Nannochloropsis salina CCMP1776 TaxID=1027361 RepID=A0A4D9D8F6_9STRA|nr:hypothetical protein NSK_000335 [Nannochloropsis salina CCMP1776]|eukprot:TFJ87981.1 hypothetical protein NSK_000335 [Nannochloropsis salina CCMP1776]
MEGQKIDVIERAIEPESRVRTAVKASAISADAQSVAPTIAPTPPPSSNTTATPTTASTTSPTSNPSLVPTAPPTLAPSIAPSPSPPPTPAPTASNGDGSLPTGLSGGQKFGVFLSVVIILSALGYIGRYYYENYHQRRRPTQGEGGRRPLLQEEWL